MPLNIKENRTTQKYPTSTQIKRVLWSVGKVVFRLIPRPFYKPRRAILRLFGASIGAHVNIANTANIYFPWNLKVGDWSSIGEHAYIYNLGQITIAEKTTISQRVHLCAGTHDYHMPTLPLLTPPIVIGEQVWVCADAFVGPNVSIDDGAVIGACSVVTKNVATWNVVAGNPAKFIKNRTLE
ncbi:MAG: putative colanic acid biosynthesis acetyltransferase WcaF [Oceanospirillaceae bacterium]|jgi:putative colanic acid biosynthesis acetyltransferase WcaF